MSAFALLLPLALAFAPRAPDAPIDEAAVAAYRAGDLESARSLWLALLDSDRIESDRLDSERLEADPPLAFGSERGRILYDLGNVAARQGDWLEAVGWYTASLRLRPRDADAWANLEHARLAAELEPADRGDLSDTLRRVLGSLTPAESGWLALLALAPLAAALFGEALRGGRVWRRLAWSALLIAALGAAPWIHGLATGGGDPVLVVDPKGVSVHSEPRTDAAALERAEAGTELERVDELPGWTRVELADGTRGWAESERFFPLRH